jgi:hypothetical protein
MGQTDRCLRLEGFMAVNIIILVCDAMQMITNILEEPTASTSRVKEVTHLYPDDESNGFL